MLSAACPFVVPLARLRPRHACAALLLSFALVAPAPLAAAPTPAAATPLLSDAEVLARADTLPLEQRRYLVYLYSRLQRPQIAEALAAALLAEAPRDRPTLLVLAGMYLENKDAAALLRTAERLRALDADDHQAIYYRAAADYLAGNVAAAARALADLKTAQFAAREFPYEADLAAWSLAAGEWPRALAAYEDLLRHRQLDDDFRADIHRAIRAIRREHSPRLEAGTAETRLDRSAVWRTTAAVGSHVGDAHWLELRYTRDDVTIDPAPGLRAADVHRAELGVSLTTQHRRDWRSVAWVGVSGPGALGGARLQHAFADQREISLELAGNARANDSLALEGLDGRQHHAALATNWQFAPRLLLAARAHARRVLLDHDPLGRGAGLDLNLDYIAREQRPRVAASYRSAVATFSTDDAFAPSATAPIADPAGGQPNQQAIVANLVSRRINRHGTALLVTDNLADAWVYRLTAGVDYDFVLSSTGWNAALGVTFLPRENIELTFEAGYTSSATASNAGSAATLLGLSARAHF